jgi:L-2-hydroxyglutarate oxidase LhgO
MAERADAVVIGAGVIGLACARELAQQGCDVLVLERHSHIGAETSSRSSEVIHAGIYYPAGSLKARLCVEGRERLYRYCGEHGVAHRRCGKLIVATDPAQAGVLRAYQRQARLNGAGSLEWLDAAAVGLLEPEVRAVAGVLSPHTGIVDSHGFMLALQADIEAHGGMLALNCEVTRLVPERGRIRVVTAAAELLACRVVNAAGLAAPMLASQLVPDTPQARYARGRYYSYSAPPPFRRLVYPIAEAGGLGIHVTLDLAGAVRFGPDVEWIDTVDYRFDESHLDAFVVAIRRYFPNLDPARLHPGYTGIRPKISGPGEAAADFRIDGPRQHRVEGFVSLMGIESPGLTASLAIAREVAAHLRPAQC